MFNHFDASVKAYLVPIGVCFLHYMQSVVLVVQLLLLIRMDEMWKRVTGAYF